MHKWISDLNIGKSRDCLIFIKAIRLTNQQDNIYMGPTWGPPWSRRPPMGPMLAPWPLLSGIFILIAVNVIPRNNNQRNWNHNITHVVHTSLYYITTVDGEHFVKPWFLNALLHATLIPIDVMLDYILELIRTCFVPSTPYMSQWLPNLPFNNSYTYVRSYVAIVWSFTLHHMLIIHSWLLI